MRNDFIIKVRRMGKLSENHIDYEVIIDSKKEDLKISNRTAKKLSETALYAAIARCAQDYPSMEYYGLNSSYLKTLRGIYFIAHIILKEKTERNNYEYEVLV